MRPDQNWTNIYIGIMNYDIQVDFTHTGIKKIKKGILYYIYSNIIKDDWTLENFSNTEPMYPSPAIES